MALNFTFKYDRQYSQQLLPTWEKVSGVDCVEYHDPLSGLVVEVKSQNYPEYQAKSWVLQFWNDSAEPTFILEDVWPLRVRVLDSYKAWRMPGYLYRINGSLATKDDFLPFETEIAPATAIQWGPVDGRSSSGACPYFNFEWADKGILVAIGWTGQWKAEIVWGTVADIKVGMERLHVSLEPGESIRTPRIVVLEYGKGQREESYNRFRRLMAEEIMPKVDVPLAHLTTVSYDGWNASTEEDVLEYVDAAGDMGFEVIWLDAYYQRDGFPLGIGNFDLPVTSIVDTERFPSGLAHIGDQVHAAGMEWLVWYCFEGVWPNTWLARERPEWLLSAPGEEVQLLNLGNSEAREYMTQYFIESVRVHKLDWLRFDCCPGTFEYWKAADTEQDRVGMTEIRWVEGLYKLLDDLLAACPELKIDNCDGGGRRLDLEMCMRTIPLWRSDYPSPFQEIDGDFNHGAVVSQASIAGLSRYVPRHSCGAFFERPYWFRSALCGGVGILEDCKGEFYPREVMRAAVEEAKRIRPLFLGNFYPLTPITLDPTAWHVVQYHLPDEDAGMVLAFRRHESPDATFECNLRGFKSHLIYEFRRSSTYQLGEWRTGGATLDVAIWDRPGSLLVEYRRPQTGVPGAYDDVPAA